jgi:hypothetical protein
LTWLIQSSRSTATVEEPTATEWLIDQDSATASSHNTSNPAANQAKHWAERLAVACPLISGTRSEAAM